MRMILAGMKKWNQPSSQPRKGDEAIIKDRAVQDDITGHN
jgi:hypothetical protein